MDDESGYWMRLAQVVGRGESSDEVRMLNRVKRGRYLTRWLDEQGAQRVGRLPEHKWRAGRLYIDWGVLVFDYGRELTARPAETYQRIEVLLPRESVGAKPTEAAAPEPEPIIEAAGAAPDTIAPARWRNKPSLGEVAAAVRSLEAEYGPSAHPAEREIVERVQALHPTATRQQVRDVLTGSSLKGEPGRKSKA